MADLAPSTRHIVEILGGPGILRVSSVAGLLARARAGFPFASLSAVASGFAIGSEEMTAILDLPERTLARRKREKRLRADESDRLLRLGRIVALAEDVLGNRSKARHWLHDRNRALGGATPLSRLDTDLGAREVENILLRIAHGVAS
jgi:putative toxin-antitoxin system antitoxin component (TIGR02293 family)